MAVGSEVILPAQPATGRVVYQPLGGNGITAPHSCYLVTMSIAGDASAGVATLGVTGDARFTNLYAWINPRVAAAAAANDFVLTLEDASGSTIPNTVVVGSLPQVSAALFGTNASFLWFPPPVYFKGSGRVGAQMNNVGVGEVYLLTLQVYCFNIDVVQRTPLPLLQWNVPGVSAPAAI